MAGAQDSGAAFAQAAARDGIVFELQTFDWASEPGHLAVEELADETGDPGVMQRAEIGVAALGQIFNRFKGLVPVLQSCRVNRPFTPVLVHEPTLTIVEVDEILHFSTPRLQSLDLYPREVRVGFDVDEYKELCRTHAPQTDRWRYGLASKCFGWHGLQNERAYHDAVRDIASWVMGYPPLVRIPAIDGDGVAAYERAREELHRRLQA
jgi:hypothetical protein